MNRPEFYSYTCNVSFIAGEGEVKERVEVEINVSFRVTEKTELVCTESDNLTKTEDYGEEK